LNPLVPVAYAACALIWGTTYFAIRVSIGPGGYPTYLAAAMRFLIAAAVLGVVVLSGLARPLPSGRKALGAILASGGLAFTSYALIYTAEERIPGGLAAVIFAMLPLVTALLVAVTGVERPSPAAVLGALLSLCGIAVISLDRLDVSPPEAVGCLMVLGGVLATAIYNILLKRYAQGAHPLALNAGFLSITAALMAALTVIVERRAPPWPPPLEPTLAVLYLAVVGTVVAFGGYFYLLRHVRLMTMSTLVLVQPLVALTVDRLFETQKIAPRTYAGAMLTLGGVLANLLAAAPRAKPSEPKPSG
jgi:drug/metabolite transporter (DMT)-like permease